MLPAVSLPIDDQAMAQRHPYNVDVNVNIAMLLLNR
jgi:hypothetical protein